MLEMMDGRKQSSQMGSGEQRNVPDAEQLNSLRGSGCCRVLVMKGNEGILKHRVLRQRQQTCRQYESRSRAPSLEPSHCASLVASLTNRGVSSPVGFDMLSAVDGILGDVIPRGLLR